MFQKLIKKTKSGTEKAINYLSIDWKFQTGDISKYGIDKTVLHIQKEKMKKLIRVYPKDYFVWIHAKTFTDAKLELVSDNLVVDPDPLVPTVIAAVKDDLERMKLFFDYYNKHGIRQYVILDNGSTDGTLEFVKGQPNTRVYSIADPYDTPKKEAWVEKAITITGMYRWYIVVDSDELINYPGSENHSLEDLVKKMHAEGHRTLQGVSLDMYTEEPLFSVNCQWNEIMDKYCWFDADTYWVDQVKNGNGEAEIIYGGPRYRTMGYPTWITKHSIFFYDRDTYIKTAHFNYPPHRFEDIKCCFAIQHYKFLNQDLKKYQDRMRKDLMGYKIYASAINSGETGKSETLKYEGSVKYENSSSLLKVKYLQDIDW